MDWRVEHLSEDRVVLVTTSGAMTLSELLEMAEEALAEMQRQNATRVLIDHRKTTPMLKVSEIYRLPDKLLAMGLPRDLKVATLYSQESSKKRDFEFYEDVCFNLGMKQVVFVDLDKALRWLHQDGTRDS